MGASATRRARGAEGLSRGCARTPSGPTHKANRLLKANCLAGRLVLAAQCWLPGTGRLARAARDWPPNTGRMLLATPLSAYHRPPTTGRRLLDA